METRAADLARLGGPVSRLAGLGLLLLFGSRARGDAAEWADWDFGYVGTSALDAGALLSVLVEATGSDRVDLRRAGGLLRHRAALDGLTVLKVRPGLADEFRLEAAAFWCDAAPVLERAYDSVLAELPR